MLSLIYLITLDGDIRCILLRFNKRVQYLLHKPRHHILLVAIWKAAILSFWLNFVRVFITNTQMYDNPEQLNYLILYTNTAWLIIKTTNGVFTDNVHLGHILIVSDPQLDSSLVTIGIQSSKWMPSLTRKLHPALPKSLIFITTRPFPNEYYFPKFRSCVSSESMNKWFLCIFLIKISVLSV